MVKPLAILSVLIVSIFTFITVLMAYINILLFLAGSRLALYMAIITVISIAFLTLLFKISNNDDDEELINVKNCNDDLFIDSDLDYK